MADHLGFYNTSSSRTHVRFQFTTNDGSGGAVAPSSAFEAADLIIYRANDGAAFSATQRASASGITMTSPFDTITGLHDVDIDLTDNTDAGFYASGYTYVVVLSPDTETVDSQTVVKVLAYFEIGVPAVNATQLGGSTQSATDLKDFADTGYDPSTHKAAVTLAASDVTGNVSAVLANSVAHGGNAATLELGSASGYALTVQSSASSYAGAFFGGGASGSGIYAQGGVGSHGFYGLGGAASGSTPAGHGIYARGGAASTTSGGTAGHGVYVIGGSGAASTNGAGDGLYAVGGGTTTVSGGSGAAFVHSGSVADLICSFVAANFAASSLDGKGDWSVAGDQMDLVNAPNATAIAAFVDATWEETLTDHSGTAGSTAEALNAAGSAGDPWNTALPGAYTSGKAGYILGTYLDAAISSRLASASYTTPLDAAGVRTAVGLATNNLDTQLGTLATSSALSIVAGNVSSILDDTGTSGVVVASGSKTGYSLASTGLDAVTAWTVAITGNITGNLSGSIGSLATQAKADVNAEVVDVMATDTHAEIGQTSPAATTTYAVMIGCLYKAWRNKKTQTSSQFSLYADDGTTVDQKATVADDGTTTTVGEITTGP